MVTKTTNFNPMVAALAKELGYGNVDEFKKALGKKRKKDKDKETGFLGGVEVGSGFGVGIKKRLDKGQGLKQSISGGYGDFKKTLTLENMKRRMLEKTFGGSGFISTFARGKLKKKYGTINPEDDDEGENGTSPTFDYLKSIAQSSLALPSIAKDMNTLRQNIVELARIERKTEDQQDLSKQGDFFKEQDALESQLEAQKLKPQTPGSPTVIKKYDDMKDSGDAGGGFLGGIIDSVKNGLLGGLTSLFNPMALLKILGKAFAIGALLYSLFEGITAGFKKWQETGDLSEAIITGLGAMIDFLTFGLFGEDSLRKLFNSIGEVVEPIIDSIKEAYYSFKDWIANNVGIPSIPMPEFIQKLGGPASIGPYYPFKKDSKSSAKENSAGEYKAKRTEEKVQKEMQKATDVIAGVSKDLGLSPSQDSTDGIVKEVSKGLEKATALGSQMPKDNKQRADILGQINSVTASNLENIKKLNAKGDYSLGRAEDYEKNVVNPVKTELATAMDKFKKGPEGGYGNMLSGSMDKAAAAISGKISAGGPAQNSLGGGASMLGGGGSSGGGTSPAPAAPSSTMGADLAAKSSQISEGQRMESAADIGSLFNAPVTNNASGSMGSGSKPQVGDTYNMDLLNLLART